MGRFISEDPARDGLNWYVYCRNNPLSFIDLTGTTTVGIGYNLSAAFILRGGGQVTVAGDKEKIGLMGSLAAGGGTPTIGGSVVLSITNAESIGQLRALGMEAGGSVSGLPIPVPGVGVELISGDGWLGANISINFEVKPWVEGHGELSYTWLLELNGKQAENAREFLNKKMQEVINKLPKEVQEKIREHLNISEKEWKELTNVGLEPKSDPNSDVDTQNNGQMINQNNIPQVSNNQSTPNSSDNSDKTKENGEKIICMELYRQGFMEPLIFKADEEFGRLLKNKMPKVLIGYQFWAKPVVQNMRGSKKFTKAVNFFAKPWTFEMAHIMGKREKGNFFGKILMGVGIPICYLIGDILTGGYIGIISCFLIFSCVIVMCYTIVLYRRKSDKCIKEV